FSSRYDLVRYDQRGFGRSDPPSAEYAESFDLRQLLDTIGISSAYFVGLSTGARVALDFAATFPTRVDGLVVVAPTLQGYRPATPEEEALWAEFDRNEDAIEAIAKSEGPERAIEVKVDRWGSALDPRTRAGVIENALDNRARALGELNPFRQKLVPATIDRLGAIRCPTLVVTGELDFGGFEGIAKLLVDRLPIVQHQVLAGADHLPNLSQPEAFNALLEQFFARLDFILMQRGTTW
ncbi:MAG TPA: alpha/beta hydrolase, partial [Thermoplasmata archaeon]|nr:alpha/beta hydrolase [Thermoplasmata archaeon]